MRKTFVAAAMITASLALTACNKTEVEPTATETAAMDDSAMAPVATDTVMATETATATATTTATAMPTDGATPMPSGSATPM